LYRPPLGGVKKFTPSFFGFTPKFSHGGTEKEKNEEGKMKNGKKALSDYEPISFLIFHSSFFSSSLKIKLFSADKE